MRERNTWTRPTTRGLGWLGLTGRKMPHCSPIRDAVIEPPQGMQADQLVFIFNTSTESRLQAILVTFDPSNANDPPELDNGGVPTTLRLEQGGIITFPFFNPHPTNGINPLTDHRWVSFEGPFQDPNNPNAPIRAIAQRIDFDANSLDTMGNPGTFASENFPLWFGHGEAACSEVQGGGGSGIDPILYAPLDPSTAQSILFQPPGGLSCESPAPSPATSSSDPTHEMVISRWVVSDPLQGPFPAEMHRFQRGQDPSTDLLVTYGGLASWLNDESFAYPKPLGAFTNLFLNDHDGETLTHGISLLFSNGSGFDARISRGGLQQPVSLALGDLDGEGGLDLVTAPQVTGRLGFLFDVSSAGAPTRGGLATGSGSSPFDVRLFDIDPSDLDPESPGVSALDIVVVRRDLDSIQIHWNDGKGRYDTTVEGALPPESFSVGDEPVALAIGHFNPGSDPEEPLADIGTADRTADTVTVLLQNPDFDPEDPGEPRFLSSSFSPGDGPSDIKVEDLNDDGHADIAVTLENDHTVEIWEGDGTGSFSFAVSLQAVDANDIALQSPTPSGLFIGDFGIATSNLIAGKIVVWKNFSTPTTWSFSAATFYTVGDQPTGIAGGDVTGDGILDLVTANKGSNDGTILPGTGSGNFGSPITIPAGTKPWRVAVGQFLGDDTVADIVFACGVSDDLVIVERDPHNPGSYRIATRLACGETPRAVASGDCNGDGVADLVSADLGSDAVSIHFRALQPITNRVDRLGYSGYFDVEVTDTDYPVADPNDPNLTIAMKSFNSPVAVRILDFDGDGTNDLVSSSVSSKSQIQVLARDPNTHLFEIVYQHPTDPLPSVRFTALATGQFDGDGDGYQDFVAANEKNDELRFFKSDGSGGFSMSTLSLKNLGGGQGPTDAQVRGVRYLLPVDGDEDGIVDDLYVVCGLGGAVIRLENDGEGSFSYGSHAVLSSEPHQIVAADLNDDGGIDLAVALAATNKVKVFLTSGSSSDALQTTASATLTIPAPEALGVGDFDGDGDIDLVVTSLSTNSLYLYLNNGSGTLTLQGTHACGPGALEIAVADLDGDEKDDVVVVNAFGEADKMLTNRSSHYSRPVTYSNGEVERIAATVIDASGFSQIAVIDLAATVLPGDTIVTSTATHHGSFDVFHSGLTWNPEGNRLYFRRDALGEVDPGLVVLRID